MLRPFSGWLSITARWLYRIVIIGCMLGLLTTSNLPPTNAVERVRAYARMQEFDYVSWMLTALWEKYSDATLNTPRYLSEEDQAAVIDDYFDLVDWAARLSREINRIYADPTIADAAKEAADVSAQLAQVRGMRARVQPFAESILQYQVSVAAAEMGLTLGGQTIPPVLYHVTDLPYALIVSPRNVIRQDADISLLPGLTVEEIEALEQRVETGEDVSALVVPVGGIGVYPTMVMSTTDLPWLLEVIAHEWIHNYLTLRPLGINYMTTPQLRTMNETAANIAGQEIGYAALQRFYPELAAQVSPPPVYALDEPAPTPIPNLPQPSPTPSPTPDPTLFSFQREMHQTRVHTDELLAAGKIEEAEAYMETRRALFWEQGYRIRRLNQAYFAFYGAYADAPGGGAAGRDPVGPAVQRLRARSMSLANFVNRISWLTSFEALERSLR